MLWIVVIKCYDVNPGLFFVILVRNAALFYFFGQRGYVVETEIISKIARVF